jgi:hypothetical protein
MRDHITELGKFVGDFLEFKQFNHIDNIIDDMKNNRQ